MQRESERRANTMAGMMEPTRKTGLRPLWKPLIRRVREPMEDRTVFPIRRFRPRLLTFDNSTD